MTNAGVLPCRFFIFLYQIHVRATLTWTRHRGTSYLDNQWMISVMKAWMDGIASVEMPGMAWQQLVLLLAVAAQPTQYGSGGWTPHSVGLSCVSQTVLIAAVKVGGSRQGGVVGSWSTGSTEWNAATRHTADNVSCTGVCADGLAALCVGVLLRAHYS